jgi:hypothetical protein
MVRKQEMTHTPKASKQFLTGLEKMEMSHARMRKDIKRVLEERAKNRGYGHTKTSDSVTAFRPAAHDDLMISSTGAQQAADRKTKEDLRRSGNSQYLSLKFDTPQASP